MPGRPEIMVKEHVPTGSPAMTREEVIECVERRVYKRFEYVSRFLTYRGGLAELQRWRSAEPREPRRRRKVPAKQEPESAGPSSVAAPVPPAGIPTPTAVSTEGIAEQSDAVREHTGREIVEAGAQSVA